MQSMYLNNLLNCKYRNSNPKLVFAKSHMLRLGGIQEDLKVRDIGRTTNLLALHVLMQTLVADCLPAEHGHICILHHLCTQQKRALLNNTIHSFFNLDLIRDSEQHCIKTYERNDLVIEHNACMGR